MIISFAKNVTMVAEGNVAQEIRTDPHPMGGMNYLGLTLNIETLIDQSTGTPKLSVYADGSNDGAEYTEITTVSITNVDATGLHTGAGAFPYGFLRLRFKLDPDGSGTKLAFMTFDAQANLTQQ